MGSSTTELNLNLRSGATVEGKRFNFYKEVFPSLLMLGKRKETGAECGRVHPFVPSKGQDGPNQFIWDWRGQGM